MQPRLLLRVVCLLPYRVTFHPRRVHNDLAAPAKLACQKMCVYHLIPNKQRECLDQTAPDRQVLRTYETRGLTGPFSLIIPYRQTHTYTYTETPTSQTEPSCIIRTFLQLFCLPTQHKQGAKARKAAQSVRNE